MTSFLVGQVTLLSSAFTSLKNCFALEGKERILEGEAAAISLPPLFVFFFLPITFSAGQEGLEPPTTDFGDRCSTKLSYWPVYLTSL